ncbi:MAG: bifunctional metallophosphatase/5'-nucleotidase [Prevotella sp.]|nr:bifunctional metallophosphatase/5'-nucleotidase [Prevotella sp.]
MRKIICLLLMVCNMNLAMAKERIVTLRFVETSDVHGCFFPYDFITREQKQGSMARVSSYVNRLRGQYGSNVILLENGDILQGQPTCYYYNYVDTAEANIAAQVVNYLRYDAATIGNHDVETGHAVYDKWVKEVACPMLGANVMDARTGRCYLQPYLMLQREGVKIAVIGMLTPAISNWLTTDLWSGLRFDNMVASARECMAYVQEHEKPDVVVGLFHSGKEGGITTDEYEEDASLKVAYDVPGFDIIFFGHDHTRHSSLVRNRMGKDVLCLDPANNALTVAEATIELTLKDDKVVSRKATGSLTDVCAEPIDEDFMTHFAPQIAKVNTFVNKQIGTFSETIHTRDCFFDSSAFNDFILNMQLQITGADVAFNAPLSFDATIKKGPVCVGDMFNLYKYENQLYVMRMTGQEIRKHLEMSYDLWVNTMRSADDHLLLLSEKTVGDQQRMGFKNLSFNFDSAAGIDYEVNVTKPDGEKVRILQMSDGRPFDENRWYHVAVNSYRGNGGGELLTRGAGIPRDSLSSRIVWRSERDQRYHLMQEIEKEGTVVPQANNNWRFVPEAWVKPAAAKDRKLLYKE